MTERYVKRTGFAFLVAAMLFALFLGEAKSGQVKPAITIRTSTLITSDTNGAIQENLQRPGGTFLIDTTELGVAQTLTVTLQFFETVSSTWRTVVISEAFSSEQVNIICVGLPVCTSASIGASSRWGIALPFKWRLRYVLNNGTNATFSVVLIPAPE